MNALWKLWAALLAFLTLGVGEDDGGAGDGDDPALAAGDDEPDPEGQEPEGDEPEGMSFDDLLSAAEGTPDKPKPGQKKERDLEVELAEERGFRRALEQQRAPAAPAPAPTYRDPEEERENAEYQRAVQAGEDEDRLAMRRWQIQSNRAIRNAARASSNAELNARDMADRAEFGRLEITNPKAFKRYASEVEQIVSNARQQGQIVARKLVMQTLIGRDFMEGKIKPRKARASASGEPAPAADRGRMPGTRSNVSARGGGKLTPGQAAAKRLEGKPI